MRFRYHRFEFPRSVDKTTHNKALLRRAREQESVEWRNELRENAEKEAEKVLEARAPIEQRTTRGEEWNQVITISHLLFGLEFSSLGVSN